MIIKISGDGFEPNICVGMILNNRTIKNMFRKYINGK